MLVNLARRYWALTIFVLLLSLLSTQFFFAQWRSEPYPAFVFPGFANAPSTTGKANFTEVRVEVVTTEKTTREVCYQRLFDTVPPVHAYILMRRLFSANSMLDRGADSERTMPVWHSGRTATELRKEFRAYLRKRLDALDFPPDASALQVSWMQRTRGQNGNETRHIDEVHTFVLTP